MGGGKRDGEKMGGGKRVREGGREERVRDGGREIILVVWACRCAPLLFPHRLVITCRSRFVVAHCCHVWVFVRVHFGVFVLFGGSALLCGLSLTLGAC